MFKYVVIFNYFVDDDFFVDSYVIFCDVKFVEIFLKRLFHNHPTANAKVFKSIEKELSDYYEY